MPRCEDFPCCGHGPVSTGGDGGGCPDASGRFKCVTCGKRLPKTATSSICPKCQRDRARMSDEERDYRDEMQDLYDRS